MAQSTTACAGSGHMIQGPEPISATMATVIRVHEWIAQAGPGDKKDARVLPRATVKIRL